MRIILHFIYLIIGIFLLAVPFSADSSASAPRSLSYDARGNVTALGGLNFTYDMSDQPVSISGTGPNGAASGTYTYDGNLKRVKSTIGGKTIYNVFDAGGTLTHIDAVTDSKATDMIGKVARITTSGGTDTVTYLHADQLGSANTGTDASGLVLWREQYTPFGTTLTSPLANNDQAGFTGHIKDSATGLNYMQARYYDPLIGRFLSRDPIGFSGDPRMFNSYTYVNNDPVNVVDPTGMCGEPCYAAARQEIEITKNMTGAERGAHSINQIKSVADFVPIVGDVKGISDAIKNPSKVNIAAAVIGLIPAAGDVVGKGMKTGANAFDALADGAKMNTDDALGAAIDVLGDAPTEIADGVFRSGDDAFQVRITNSDLAKTNNHAGAPHMNVEKLGTNARGKTVVKENKHIFLPEEQ